MEQQFTLGQQRLDAYERRGGGAGGGSAAKVRSTKTNADGEVMAIMSDGTIKPLGIQDQAFGKAVAAAVAKMDGDRQYRKLSEAEKISLAKSRLAGGVVGAEVDELPPAAPAAVPASPARSASSGGGAAGDIAANDRSIASLRKQPLNKGETQSSRDEQIRMIETENARMRGAAAPTAAKAAPVAQAYRAGEQRVVAEGPNKGKTAVYDGTGWKLK